MFTTVGTCRANLGGLDCRALCPGAGGRGSLDAILVGFGTGMLGFGMAVSLVAVDVFRESFNGDTRLPTPKAERVWAFGESVDELLGLTDMEARARAEALGLEYRDVDAAEASLMNASTGRVNVWYADGVVGRAWIT